MGNWELTDVPTHTHTHIRNNEEDEDYLELHQVDVHVSAVAVLTHRVCELCDSVAGRSQPGLDLRQVEDDLPVGDGVERRRFSGPTAQVEWEASGSQQHWGGVPSSLVQTSAALLPPAGVSARLTSLPRTAGTQTR